MPSMNLFLQILVQMAVFQMQESRPIASSKNCLMAIISICLTCILPNTSQKLPYVLFGDDAFPLTPYMMKPYPFRNQNDQQRIYSYRLSRVRRVIINAFDILTSKIRVLHRPINLHPNEVEKIVLACIAL